MTATTRPTDPDAAQTHARTPLALQTLAVAAWLAAIGYEAGAPRTAIWSVPWIVVYVLGAAGALAVRRSATHATQRWLGAGGAALCALGAALHSAVGPGDVASTGVLRMADLPLILALGLISAGIVDPRDGARDAGRHGDRIAALGVGVFLVWWLTLLTEYVARPNLWHGSEFYVVTGAAVPCALAFAATIGGRWGATWAAGTYMVILLVTSWLLRAVPLPDGGRLLAPPFPLVLAVPAVAIDLSIRGVDATRRRLARALLLGAAGTAFVVAALAVHWPLADWLLRPSVQLPGFATAQWPFHAPPGHWRYEYWTLDPGTRRLAAGLALAVVLGVISATAGWALARWTAGSEGPRTTM